MSKFWFLTAAAVAIISAGMASGCSHQLPDPQTTYSEFVKLANAGKGAEMYDMMDSAKRADIDAGIQTALDVRDKMPVQERQKWDPLAGMKGKEAFAKLTSMSKADVVSELGDNYKVLAVDTFMVLTIQRPKMPANRQWMRVKNGQYQLCDPPDRKARFAQSATQQLQMQMQPAPSTSSEALAPVPGSVGPVPSAPSTTGKSGSTSRK